MSFAQIILSPSLSLHPASPSVSRALSLSLRRLHFASPDVHRSGSAFNYAYEQMRNSVIAQSGAVCGSNAKDYKNLCELAKASCASQTRITIKYFGLCGMWPVVLNNLFTNLHGNDENQENIQRESRSSRQLDDAEDFYD